MMGGYGYATEYDMERHVRATLVTADLRRHQRDPARDHRPLARFVKTLLKPWMVRAVARHRDRPWPAGRAKFRH